MVIPPGLITKAAEHLALCGLRPTVVDLAGTVWQINGVMMSTSAMLLEAYSHGFDAPGFKELCDRIRSSKTPES